MIKVERKSSEKAEKAIESLRREKARSGSYNTPEVNAALREMFHGKCYIVKTNRLHLIRLNIWFHIAEMQI